MLIGGSVDTEFCHRCKSRVGRACGTDESEKDCSFALRQKRIRQDSNWDEKYNLDR